jgi:hypothetical protein
LNYPINAGAFPQNLPDIVTAQQEEDPGVTGHLLNNSKRFLLQNYSSNKLISHQASDG